MLLEALLLELGHKTGLGTLTLNEHHVCRLVFDGELTVDFETLPDGDRFFVHGVVGPAGSDSREPLFAELLTANLFGQGTGGACLALDPQRNEILLFKEFVAEQTDYATFESTLERFLNRLSHWRNRFLTGTVSPVGHDDSFLFMQGIRP